LPGEYGFCTIDVRGGDIVSRMFIAIRFTPVHRHLLKETAEQSRSFVTHGKYVPHDLYHLTVQFLGEMKAGEAELVRNELAQCAEIFPPFELEFDRMGYFEKRNKAILWIGIRNHQALIELHEEVHQRISKLGFADERSFRPHITIARQVAFNDERSKENLIKKPINIQSFCVDQIDLMESIRLDDHLTYRSIKAYKLTGEKGFYS